MNQRVGRKLPANRIQKVDKVEAVHRPYLVAALLVLAPPAEVPLSPLKPLDVRLILTAFFPLYMVACSSSESLLAARCPTEARFTATRLGLVVMHSKSSVVARPHSIIYRAPSIW